MARLNRRSWARGVLFGLALLAAAPLPAAAVSIELDDVAADRIERQRNAAVGNLPLPGTPDLARLPERLQEAGVDAGAEVLLRVFKASSELELWMRKGDAFVLFATYPICHWSGTLGPKLREGDRQTPEGFYTITSRQLHLAGRWPRSLNLGFPNVLDKAQARHGSFILVHGGCSSTGCFAMTNPVSDEIYSLTAAALRAGQEHVPVHVFPFRMTEENLAAHQQSDWQPFWRNLKDGYDRFETTRRPPRVSVCEGRYHFDDAGPGEVGAESPLAVCAATAAALEALEQ
jgi:murein L,D-transpeptidase YafK